MNEYEVGRVEAFLSTFSSRYDEDIEEFIKVRAIDFSKRGIARTHLVTCEISGEKVLLGYFTLTNKVLQVPLQYISKTISNKLSRFGLLDVKTKSYSLPLPLIAQLGKNYAGGLDERIRGDELLKIACDKVATIQHDLGGRYTYIECGDNAKLVEFYIKNGFFRIDGGNPSNIYDISEPYLIQMLKTV